MSKSTKATVAKRIEEVTKLLVHGAEFEDIRQIATTRGWGVSDRQIRRYMKWALERMAKDASRDRRQVLGLHLKKRRALYAQSIRGDNHRLALQIIRDEAKLQGLYPPTNGGSKGAVADDPPSVRAGSRLAIRKRVARYLAAQLRNDEDEIELVEQASEHRNFAIADLHIEMDMLHTMALIYLQEQQEYAAAYWYASYRDLESRHAVPALYVSKQVCAYRFWANREGWNRFAQWLGTSGEDLLKLACGNNSPTMDMWQKEILAAAPTAKEVRSIAKQAGLKEPMLPSPQYHAGVWREMFGHVYATWSGNSRAVE